MLRLSPLVVLTVLCVAPIASSVEPIDIGGRRELMVDRFLIDTMKNTSLRAHEPRDEGVALRFDKPWEGLFCGYVTILKDGPLFRAYYRGKMQSAADGAAEVYCVAESKDGRAWTKPNVGVVEHAGSRDNNIVLGNVKEVAHNFSPLIDARPGTPKEERYKAIGGTVRSGLMAFVSADGLRWRKLREEPVLTKAMVNAVLPDSPHMFDSQNLAFWSAAEGKYVMFFRVFKDKVRRICRAESTDFTTWSNIQLMEYRTADGSPAPVEHLYTSQTHPYVRADHIYISLAARFMPRRQVLSDEEAAALKVEPKYFKDTSDAILQTTRGGNIYDRTFLGSFIRPGIGLSNWVSRTNYPALNSVQTGPTELSVYVNQDYAQPTAHLRRYSLRLDGFASVAAPYEGGEMVTKPLKFSGRELMLNYATSAAGGIRVEVQDAAGKPIPGYTLADSVETIGNEIERAARWKKGADVSKLAGQPVRLRFVMKDADLYALRFAETR